MQQNILKKGKKTIENKEKGKYGHGLERDQIKNVEVE